MDNIEFLRSREHSCREYAVGINPCVGSGAAVQQSILARADEFKAAAVEIERQREALGQIAKQKTTEEMDEDERDRADFEGGYDRLIEIARKSLQPQN